MVKDASLEKSVALIPAGHDTDPTTAEAIEEAPGEPMSDDPPSRLLHATPMSATSAIIAMIDFCTDTSLS